MLSMKIKNILFFCAFTLLTACGSSQDAVQNSANNGSATPSASSNNADPNSFFNTQQLQQTFSPDLQHGIHNYEALERAAHPGEAAMETSFGPIYPDSSTPHTSSPSTSPASSPSDPCDVRVGNGEPFLCALSPENNFEVSSDSLAIRGAVNMSSAAIYAPADPVVLISIFKLQGTSFVNMSESVVTGNEVTTTRGSHNEVGIFNKTITLSGPGIYRVVLASFELSTSRLDIALRSVILEGKRQGQPELQLMNVKAEAPGNLMLEGAHRTTDEIANNATVSAFSVLMQLKMLSPGVRGVGVFIQNYGQNEGGTLRYQTGVAMSNDENQQSETSLKLYPGLNCFRVSALNPALVGSTRFELPQFCVNNNTPTIEVKVLNDSPVKDGAMIQVDSHTASDTQNLSFCLVNHGMLPTPIPHDQCITGWSALTRDDPPTFKFNGIDMTLPSADSGVYNIPLNPQVGINVYSISVTRKNLTNPGSTEAPMIIGSSTGAFGFGKLNRLQDFTPRGLSLELKASFFDDAKRMLQVYVNKPELQQTIKDALARNQQGSHSPACSEFATAESPATYPYTLHFDSPQIYDNIVIESLQPTSVNGLQIQLVINNFNPDASIHIPGYPALPDPVTGLDTNVTLLKFHIQTLRVSIGVHFNKVGEYNSLDIRALEGIHGPDGRPLALDIVSSHGSGAIITIENPGSSTAARLRSILQPQFLDAFNKTLLCDVEKTFNTPAVFDPTNPPAGGFTTSFAQWASDILKVQDYDATNPLRLAFRQHFDSLNRDLGLDVSYNVLKGDFQFTNQSLRINNIPIRINPSPAVHHLTDEILAGTVGSMSSPLDTTSPTSTPFVRAAHVLGLGLSEDIINQALFAANATGLLNLTIDSNFYTDNNIGFFSSEALPNAIDMLGSDSTKLDLNQDGIVEVGESDRPVQMRLALNPNFPPNVHFLTHTEKMNMIERVRTDRQHSTPMLSGSLSPDLNYIRITIPNVDISFYAVDSNEADTHKFCATSFTEAQSANEYTRISPMLAGVAEVPEAEAYDQNTHLCRESISQTREIALNQACTADSFSQPSLISETDTQLDTITVRTHNSREIHSALPGVPNAPLVRLKANLILHAVYYPLKRELPFADFLNGETLQKLMTHIRFIPNPISTKMNFENIQVVENNTALKDSAFGTRLVFLIQHALLENQCQRLNDFGIPIPTRFPDIGTAPSGLSTTLRDLGVAFVKLGGMQPDGSDTAVPQMDIKADDSDLFLDVSSALGVCYRSNASCNPPLVPYFQYPASVDPSFSIRH